MTNIISGFSSADLLCFLSMLFYFFSFQPFAHCNNLWSYWLTVCAISYTAATHSCNCVDFTLPTPASCSKISITNPTQQTTPSMQGLALSTVALPVDPLTFSFPFHILYAAEHSGVTWNGNGEVLTVTGCVLLCLRSPVRRGLQQTNKGICGKLDISI